jgi:hypothetical protein
VDSKSNCTDWRAIHDFMPPRPARLRVNGKCTFPTPGYKVTLKKKQPQGINPNILILEKVVEAPTTVEPQIVTTVPVQYEEITDQHYTDASILPDNTSIRVEEVH